MFECPIIGGSCIGIPYTETGTGVSAASASPSSLSFGSVPINTTVSRDVTISVDAGYRTEVASGSGLNPPFAFDFDTCGSGGGFSGPGTCNVKERYTPTALTSSSGNHQRVRVPDHRRHLHRDPLHRNRHRDQHRLREPVESQLR